MKYRVKKDFAGYEADEIVSPENRMPGWYGTYGGTCYVAIHEDVIKLHPEIFEPVKEKKTVWIMVDREKSVNQGKAYFVSNAYDTKDGLLSHYEYNPKLYNLLSLEIEVDS